MEIKLTVLIPTYNAEHRLTSCLKSLEVQSEKSFFILISDNCSSDRSPQIIESFAERRENVTASYQKTNLGAQGNFLYLLDQVKTEFFIFLDSEDELSSDFVKNFYLCLDESHPHVTMFSPNFVELGANLLPRSLSITNRLKAFPERFRFLSAINSNSFEGLGHLFYSVFKTKVSSVAVRRVLSSEPLGSLDISAAWFFLYTFNSIEFFDGELFHYSRHYSVNETRHALNNQFISEQYAHLDYQTAITALRQFLDLCKPDLGERDFTALKNGLERFFAAKYSFIHSYQQVRGCLGLPPFLS